ncbi:alpha/beta hydrolase fold domain-containing protein [Luteolibacter pohnpeiensis]|uniref:Alpha/beta hydrolase fold domain-containing protein n=1 Tax=Luteolibacter pohnpeiensis TaxID=454153 RepID=A0A934S6Z2_9BACT|nr:alpha/beta hydrolase fold domain-containing protein [Luteolibacter pohnpeiensis]MBK1881941.1 alpha/beta hydrolase fold domain-containing protein [Luteolibacter pohnpeiensis]
MVAFGALVVGLKAAEPWRIPVWPGKLAPNGDGNTSPATTSLTIYQPEHPNGAAAVICPGGGYSTLVTEPEGHGIARWLNSHGITGMVLEYRLPHGRPMVPLLDLQRAIRLARSNAGAWGIDPHRLGVIGFSAGGHLVATAATHFDSGANEQEGIDPVQRFSSRPDFAVLIYPVITMGEGTHAGSRDNLLGQNPNPELLDEFSAEKQVSDESPPAFLAHAKDDTLVPIRNSELFADAMRKHHVEVELLKLPSGGHGLNGYHGDSWDAWQAACLKWMDAQGISQAKPSSAQKTGKTIAVTDEAVLAGISPLNWIRSEHAIHSAGGGASFRLAFMHTDRVLLNVDTSANQYPYASRFPIVGWTVNQGPVQTHQLKQGETSFVLSAGVANPIIEFYIKGMSPFEDRYRGDVPPNSVTITGFTVDRACSIKAPPAKPLWVNIGDSILSGDGAAYADQQGRPADDRWAGSDDAWASYGYLLAQHYGYQESRLAFGGYAWTGGLGNLPPLAELVDHLTSTTSRLTQEKWVPAPGVVLINLGENGAPPEDAVVAALQRLRQRCGAETKIIVMIPVSGRARAEITNGLSRYRELKQDSRIYLADLGLMEFPTIDGQHPTTAGHQMIYQAALQVLDQILK